ncbi:MAG: 2Fe-2S iron-sulfur cluster-binding protein [Paracoccaceae bacterium]
MQRKFHNLTVAEIQREIDGEATNVTFGVPTELTEQFAWQAGQHLTVRFRINGEEHRRSYTISNPPGAALRITVKRVKGGVVSNHIGDALAPGDHVDVMPPFGHFRLEPKGQSRRTHYLFGAGSGITPLYAMIASVLKNEPHSSAHLIYANKNAASIIFQDKFEKLLAQYPERLTIRHILSRPSILSWFSPWRTGRMDASAIQAAISETPPIAQDTQYWICGPGSMNANVRAALQGLDVPSERIHMESFGGIAESDVSVTGVAATARIVLNGETTEVPVAIGQTILEAAQSAWLDPPFSCQSGVCGACVARLTDGSVHMRNRMALEDAEIAKGLILSCQSVATQSDLTVKFEWR